MVIFFKESGSMAKQTALEFTWTKQGQSIKENGVTISTTAKEKKRGTSVKSSIPVNSLTR